MFAITPHFRLHEWVAEEKSCRFGDHQPNRIGPAGDKGACGPVGRIAELVGGALDRPLRPGTDPWAGRENARRRGA